MNLAFIQTAFLGDLLLSTPTFINIKKHFPNSCIFLVCRKGIGSLLKELKLVDEIIEVEKGNKSSYREAVKKLNQLNLDYLICPHPSFRSGWLSHQVKVHQSKIGFNRWYQKIFFTESISYFQKLPEALRQLSLISPLKKDLFDKILEIKNVDWNAKDHLGILPSVPEWSTMNCRSQLLEKKLTVDIEIVLKDHFKIESEQLFKYQKLVFLFPGSVWNTKRWTEEGYIAVSKWLLQNNYFPVWMGGNEEKSICEDLQRRSPGSLSLAGKTNLVETAILLARGSLVVGNDSGSSHLASLAGVPVISIFGPTVLSFGYRPWSSSACIVEKEGLSCRPCGLHGSTDCPIATHSCMEGLSSQEVIEKVKWFLMSRN